ncbi:hypothetical protein B0H13DRAFT_1901817 [Mycena leptocephala]|nr:hypothetical protein B0H13DRAFT_1901817 [Mycena leptocephala]
MSAKLRTSSTRRENGRTVKERKTLTATKVLAAKKEEAQRHADRRAAMTQAERLRLDQLRNVPDAFDNDDTYERDVLAGNTATDISHAGEALARDEENRADATLMDGLLAAHRRLWGCNGDTRTRRNRTQQHVDAFEAQLERMADAYLSFSLAVDGGPLPSSLPTPEDAILEETRDVLVVDMFVAAIGDVGGSGAQKGSGRDQFSPYNHNCSRPANHSRPAFIGLIHNITQSSTFVARSPTFWPLAVARSPQRHYT